MKRLVIVLLLISLLVIPTAQAEDAPMRRLKLEATVSGDILDVRVYAEINYPNATSTFESVDFSLSYSQDILELIESVKTEKGLESDILDDSFYMENPNETGRYSLSAVSMAGKQGSGLLLHLRFKILGEGYYGFRLVRSLAAYSIYDSAADKSESYQLPRMDIEAEVNGSNAIADIPDDLLEKPAETLVEMKEQPKENGFLRFLRSIFGSSCFGG